MNSKIALTAALLLAGGVGAAAYAGGQTQRDVREQLAQVQAAVGRLNPGDQVSVTWTRDVSNEPPRRLAIAP